MPRPPSGEDDGEDDGRNDGLETRRWNGTKSAFADCTPGLGGESGIVAAGAPRERETAAGRRAAFGSGATAQRARGFHVFHILLPASDLP